MLPKMLSANPEAQMALYLLPFGMMGDTAEDYRLMLRKVLGLLIVRNFNNAIDDLLGALWESGLKLSRLPSCLRDSNTASSKRSNREGI